MRNTCSVEWCERVCHGGGLCMTHYKARRERREVRWVESDGVRSVPCKVCGTTVTGRRSANVLCDGCKQQRAREATAKYNANNPDRVRERGRITSKARRADPAVKRRLRDQDLRRTYGISLDFYEALLEAQNYRCAICRDTPVGPGRKLHVDHDHANADVRGLLCSRCNTMLGLARDNPEILEQAAVYLEHSGRWSPNADQRHEGAAVHDRTEVAVG